MTKKVFCDICDKHIVKMPVYQLQKYDKDFWKDDSCSWFVFEYICNSCFKKIKELRSNPLPKQSVDGKGSEEK